MLQQTRAATVIPYYRHWMRRFPSVKALAAASPEQVLRAWEGLGYYRRAQHLHRAARRLAAGTGGRLPRTAMELRALPGIGPYTAAAIASIAFGADEIALDGNLRRVLSRLFDLRLQRHGGRDDRQLAERARAFLPPGRAGDFNQALMDLGSQICTPRNPGCSECPLAGSCLAFRRGTVGRRRWPLRRQPLPMRQRIAAVIRKSGAVLLLRRPDKGLLAGLWEFPSAARRPNRGGTAKGPRRARAELSLQVQLGRKLGVYRQTYSHFEARVSAFEARLVPGSLARIGGEDRRWAFLSQLQRYPMGRVDRRIAQELQKASHARKSR